MNGEHTAPSNVAFSQRLEQQNPEWGGKKFGFGERGGLHEGVSVGESGGNACK